jgi:ATP-dependent DNA helicase MPH1
VQDTGAAARLIPWIDVEAGHSGDEVSSGLSSREEEEESESDRRFVTDMPATQPSLSYDQSAVYRQSLLSQAPARTNGTKKDNNNNNKLSLPAFAAPPARRGAASAPRRERVPRLSSPVPPADEEDYYMLGSFVVDDEAEISFMPSSSEP